MVNTLIEILPLALAATISPSGLLFVTMILSGKENPKRHAVLFLVGSITFLFILGIILLFTFKSALNSAEQPHTLSGILDIVFGVLVILFIGQSLIFGKKKKPEDKKKHKYPFFVMGFGFMIINTSSLIPFIAACKIITDGDLGAVRAMSLLAILIAIAMLMISFPVIITILMPKKSDVVMVPVKSFMAKHGSVIAKGYFILIAVYLIYHGIVQLQG
ncbi:MAG: GAP family protein [Thermoleophilia bacterium]|nr:GAP family protein [Thermoleophilia bacterium]